ncbi:hypoxic response protein Hrp1 [Streptomyces sannanensis]|uniref:Hypoxic response protein Hrp1 n=1 Tax=Streptomyces sannanensis TaxID=285536 RepID=A0ABP6SKS3_9ACTN
MLTARDLMTGDLRVIPATETLDRAAQVMRDHDFGALPVRSSDGELTGIVTDRDIVVKCVAAGKDPSRVTAGDLAQGNLIAVDADAGAAEAVKLMSEARVRRIVVMEAGRPVGMISEANLVRKLPANQIASFTESVYGTD